MNPWFVPLAVASTLCVALFGFAFLAAPRSCEWGLEAYCWAGGAVVVVLLAVSVAAPVSLLLWQRVLLALGLAGAGVLVWLAGLFASNMRIICRLF
ncbi:MAG: hypothetical protein KAY46_10560 [Burkholderiaceae bacterium]|nr:hypothetical protein [Burkholderiaceae bacterium]